MGAEELPLAAMLLELRELRSRVEALEELQRTASPDRPLLVCDHVDTGFTGTVRFDGLDFTVAKRSSSQPWIVINLSTGTVAREANRSNPNDASKVYYHQDRTYGDIVFHRA